MSSKVAILSPTNGKTPTDENGTVGRPNRRRNDELRTRMHLLPEEIELLIQAASKGRRGHRDATMIRMAYLHGLRVSELVGLRWDDVSFKERTLHVRRLKGSKNSTHYLDGTELRALRRLHRDASSPFIFESERRGPISAAGFRKAFARLGAKTRLPFPINPHMLRHACGYALANKGKDTRSLQAYLGHASIVHTVKYTDMSPVRFKGFWD